MMSYHAMQCMGMNRGSVSAPPSGDLGAPDSSSSPGLFSILGLALVAGGAAIGAVSYPKSRVTGGLVGGAAGLGAAVLLSAAV